jgi:Mn-dependent DtxR family transcriptional regulator
MRDTTKTAIINMVARDGQTFWSPVAIALKVKPATADRYLQAMEEEGLLRVTRQDGCKIEYSLSAAGQTSLDDAAHTQALINS